MKILAAVLTHNRSTLLQRCLDYIDTQTRKPDDVIVVNNASTDGTVGMLVNRGTRFLTQENVGSAGGWHRCIETALDEGFDAIWLMDDDGYPDPTSLALLERALSPDVACVSSVVIRENDLGRFVFPFPLLDTNDLPVLLQHPRKLANVSDLQQLAPDGSYPFAHLFNGALISLAAIREVGNIEQEFFIYGDEVDYFFRLRKAGRVISLLCARHYHPDVSQRPYSPAKVYYYIKNTLVLNRRYFNAVWLRNTLTLFAILARTAHRNGIGMALSLIAGRKAPIFYSAILRGLSGQIGKDFRG
jgi:GT2 family glycosyltransferase